MSPVNLLPEPPREIPSDLLAGYTMNGRIGVSQPLQPLSSLPMSCCRPSRFKASSASLLSARAYGHYSDAIRSRGLLLVKEVDKSAHVSLTDSRFNYPRKGFCSIVCGLLDIAVEHYAEYNNLNVSIEDSQTLSLFDCISSTNENVYDAGSWFLDRHISGTLIHSQYTAHTLANLDNLRLKRRVYDGILQIKGVVQDRFDNLYSQLEIGKNTLGIQIRGTDKRSELPEIGIDRIYEHLEIYLNTRDVDKIFVSTDDRRYLSALIGRYGSMIIYDDMLTISEDSQPLHHNIRKRKRARINEEVLSSVYLLSKCRHLLYSFSNVSLLALIMGVHNLESFRNIN